MLIGCIWSTRKNTTQPLQLYGQDFELAEDPVQYFALLSPDNKVQWSYILRRFLKYVTNIQCEGCDFIQGLIKTLFSNKIVDQKIFLLFKADLDKALRCSINTVVID